MQAPRDLRHHILDRTRAFSPVVLTGVAGLNAPSRSNVHFNNKMIFRPVEHENGIPTIAVSLAVDDETTEGVILRGQVDTGSQTNILDRRWLPVLQAAGMALEDIEAVTLGWITPGHTYRITESIRCYTKVLGFAGAVMGVMEGIGDDIIIGVESMRDLEIINCFERIISIQRNLGLLYSNPSAEEDPPIRDMGGDIIDTESRFGPSSFDLVLPNELQRLVDEDQRIVEERLQRDEVEEREELLRPTHASGDFFAAVHRMPFITPEQEEEFQRQYAIEDKAYNEEVAQHNREAAQRMADDHARMLYMYQYGLCNLGNRTPWLEPENWQRRYDSEDYFDDNNSTLLHFMTGMTAGTTRRGILGLLNL